VAKKKKCLCCGQTFTFRPQNPNQHYCPNKSCQRARKSAWQKQKQNEDQDYRESQKQAQKKWRQKHADYYRHWRNNHPEYVARNREQQKKRNDKRQKSIDRQSVPIAKMDASNNGNVLLPGVYELLHVPTSPHCKDGCVNQDNLFKIRCVPT